MGAGGREVSSRQWAVGSGRKTGDGGRETGDGEPAGRVVARAGGVRVSRGPRMIWRGVRR
jgi:hypothetical protein